MLLKHRAYCKQSAVSTYKVIGYKKDLPDTAEIIDDRTGDDNSNPELRELLRVEETKADVGWLKQTGPADISYSNSQHSTRSSSPQGHDHHHSHWHHAQGLLQGDCC